MAKREYIATIKCAEPGCNETVHYRCDNRKDQMETWDRQNGKWKCLYHDKPDFVIKPGNLKAVFEEEFTSEVVMYDAVRPLGMFWKKPGDKHGRGLVTAHPLLSYSKPFPAGTKLRIRIEIEAILPDKDTE